MFYTKQDFATAAIDAVTAFNNGDIVEADAAHKRMDEMLCEAANRKAVRTVNDDSDCIFLRRQAE
ncbi:MAG: hypothetical protein DBP02_01955 [gamma proteobacterium symbiont of Ctena orbiculata]|nr:MAG: hypothetical protein DBP02_01955 [gamma proteobacterium symbiont of Ctena orbiculata]